MTALLPAQVMHCCYNTQDILFKLENAFDINGQVILLNKILNFNTYL